MNSFGIQRNEIRGSSTVPVSERREAVICPKPRRLGFLNSINDQSVRSLRSELSHQDELCESGSDLLDIIMRKGGCSALAHDCPEAIIAYSPPSRVSNPLTQDSRFRDGFFIGPSPSHPLPTAWLQSSPSSGRTGKCVRANFVNNPKVTIVGFKCVDRERRSIPALA